MSETVSIRVAVNGRTYERAVAPRLLLSDFLRHELELTGTHVGCEHGVCGACTILFDGEAVRSCLMFAVQAHGHTLTTSKGWRRKGRRRCIRCKRPSATPTACNAASAPPAS